MKLKFAAKDQEETANREGFMDQHWLRQPFDSISYHAFLWILQQGSLSIELWVEQTYMAICEL